MPATLWRNGRVVPCTSVASAAAAQADAIVTEGARIEWVGRESVLPPELRGAGRCTIWQIGS